MQTLHVEQLSIERGDRTVLSGLSFGIAAGEIVHLVGRNGAGKTSLLETLCGLRQPRTGRIGGRPEPAERHWIGHRNGLSLALSPLENLRFWAAVEGFAPTADALVEALYRVELHTQRHRPVASLSTGQKRRAALARVALTRRPWWFLDEPLAGLDDGGLAVFAELLSAHQAAGGAAMVTSHQPLPGISGDVRILTLAA